MSRKIKTFGIFWENIEYGGVSTHIEDLITSGSFKNVNFVIFTNTTNAAIEKIKKKLKHRDVKIILYKSFNVITFNNFFLKLFYLIFRPVFFLLSIFQTWLLLKKFKFDIFLAECGGYGNFRTEIASIIAATIIKYPIKSVVIHHCYAKPYLWSSLISLIDRLVSRCASNFIFGSLAVKNNIQEKTNLLKNNNKIEVIHHGVSIIREERNLEKLNYVFNKVDKNIFKIGMLSRIEYNKGQIDLVMAFNQLPDKLKEKINIFFIGESKLDEVKKIKKKIEAFKLNNFFHFPGYIDCDSISILSRLDLLVSLTKEFEGFGLSLAESLFAETPILSTNVGAVSEFLNNKNSKLIPPNNLDAVTSSLIDFIKSNNEWKNRASKGKKIILENFTAEIMAKKYYSNGEKLIENNYTRR